MMRRTDLCLLAISISLFATSARADIVYLTYCPNLAGATCQRIYYQCTNDQHSADVRDCVKQPDTEVALPE